MDTSIFRVGLPLLGALALGAVTGCSDVTALTKERVARAETSVQQAQQTVGNSETGALEMQRAKDNLDRSRQALNDKKGKTAERYGQLAQLDAELAVAKSQTASARRAADELQASIKTLREESARGEPLSDDR
jgi:capsule polysaccharide export protein KpsE/RkpR